MAEMRGVVGEFDKERMLNTNLPAAGKARHLLRHRTEAGFQIPFNFNLMWQPRRAAALQAYILKYESALPEGGWPSWVLGNHDQKRIASRVGPRQALVAMLILLALRGTPTLYYG
ncbi:MAG: alpha-amylase family glycosyl hydrolase [Alphaproteobacteria bacterium]